MAVEHQYRNLTKEEQIRCILRLLELLMTSGEIDGESGQYRKRNDQTDGETDKETNKRTDKEIGKKTDKKIRKQQQKERCRA